MSSRPGLARTPENVNWKLPSRYEGKMIRNRLPQFNEKWLCLTFDDGPDPQLTAELLDCLKEYDQKATFFVLGWRVKKWPQLVKRMFDEGHTIGSHTYMHRANPSYAQAVNEMRDTSELIKQACGKYPTTFRPPYGITSSWTNKIALQQGMTSALWTISSADTSTKYADIVYKNCMHTPRPGDIVLIHDIHPHSVEASKVLIKDLTADGWTLVTLDTMLRAWDATLAAH